MSQTIPEAVKIGKVIEAARLGAGYKSRAALINAPKIAGKLTGEGLRKIEHGERLPRLDNLRLLSEHIGIPEDKIQEMEKLVLKKSIERAARKAGNAQILFFLDGKPVRVTRLPAKKKAEEFARDVVAELELLGEKLGWWAIAEDKEWFRKQARNIILKKLEGK